MSKVEMMLADRPVPRALRPPKPEPIKPPPPGPLFRWVRRGPRERMWRPWWLLGLVEVVSHVGPRFEAGDALYVPGVRASCGLPGRAALMLVVAR